MRIISNGAICAVKSKEQRRLDRFRAAQDRKAGKNGNQNTPERPKRKSDICR